MLYTVEPTLRPTAPGLDPAVERYRHPVLFYGLATAIPWVVWLAAGALSRLPQHPDLEAPIAVLGLVGLAAPIAVAAALVSRDPLLRRDAVRRLANLREVPAWVWALAVLLLPGALLVATALSLPLGYAADQFLLRGGASFTTGAVPALLTLTLAPLLEELAWHSYGTDALAARWTVWRTSIVFAVIWAAWHLPLATIQGNYQAEVVDAACWRRSTSWRRCSRSSCS